MPAAIPDGWQRARSGLVLPPAPARRRYSRPIGIDLFSGCGGFSLGFIQAGWQVLGAGENDCPAAITYMNNLGSYPIDIHYVEPEDKERLNRYIERTWKPRKGQLSRLPVSGAHRPADQPPVEHFWFGDVRRVRGADMLDALGLRPGELDCVFGGPPCQGFSLSGKRHVMDPRNSLVFEFARLVLELQPRAMVMENVPGIVSMVTPEGLPVLDAVARVLADGGFAGYEALRRSLLATAGLGAALRGRANEPAEGDQVESDELAEQQPGVTVQAALPFPEAAG